MKTNKKIYFLIAAFLPLLVFGQKGIINNGANLVLKNNIIVNIQGSEDDVFLNRSVNTAGMGTIELNGNINLGINWENNSANEVFINENATGNIVFSGNFNQQVGGLQRTSFINLTVNNNYGISLNNDISISGTLSLLNGPVMLGNSNMTMLENSLIYRTDNDKNTVVANQDGYLKKVFATSGSFMFPLATKLFNEIYFTPFTLTANSGAFSAESTIGANVKSEKFPDNPSEADYLNRYWNIVGENIGTISYDCNFTYLSSDIVGEETNIYGGLYSTSGYSMFNVADASENMLSFMDVTQFGAFTGVDGKTPALLSFSPLNGDIGVPHFTTLILEFDENIQKNSGQFKILKLQDNSEAVNLDVSDENIEVINNEVWVSNVLTSLEEGTSYYVNFNDGIMTDANLNGIMGMAGNSTWSFTTNAAPVIDTIPSQSVVLGESFNDIDLDQYVEDDVTPDETIDWQVSGQQNLSINFFGHVAQISVLDEEWTGSETVNFKATDEEGLSNETSVTFTISTVYSFMPSNDDGVRIFPNPTTGVFYVELNQKTDNDAHLKLYNNQGVLIKLNKKSEWQRKGQTVLCKISSELVPGIYFLSIQNKDSIILKKVIIE